MLDEKYVDAICEIPADRLYNLLMAEAEWLALTDNGVEKWDKYQESLDKYIPNMMENASIFYKASVPTEKTKNFKDYADWESKEILKQYLKKENENENKNN